MNTLRLDHTCVTPSNYAGFLFNESFVSQERVVGSIDDKE